MNVNKCKISAHVIHHWHMVKQDMTKVAVWQTYILMAESILMDDVPIEGFYMDPCV